MSSYELGAGKVNVKDKKIKINAPMYPSFGTPPLGSGKHAQNETILRTGEQSSRVLLCYRVFALSFALLPACPATKGTAVVGYPTEMYRGSHTVHYHNEDTVVAGYRPVPYRYKATEEPRKPLIFLVVRVHD